MDTYKMTMNTGDEISDVFGLYSVILEKSIDLRIGVNAL